MKRWLAAFVLLVSLSAHADPITFTENFDAGLGAFSPSNLSPNPSGPGWFPGNSGIFPAHAGDPGAYAAANFLAATSGGILAWLFGPTLDFVGQTVSFFARTEDPSLGFLDGLILMVSSNGASTNPADFVPLLAISDLAGDWTQYSALLDTVGNGRIAFLYVVGDVDLANYIGLDTVSVSGGGGNVPEPGSLALIALGLGLAGLMRRRASRSAP